MCRGNLNIANECVIKWLREAPFVKVISPSTIKPGRIKAAILLAGIALSGTAIAQSDQAPIPAQDPVFLAAMSKGQQVYVSKCIGCHGPSGEGPAAKLAGSHVLERKGAVITQVIDGGHFMPPFSQLTNEEVAGVSTYVRNSFGNIFGAVSAFDVAEYR